MIEEAPLIVNCGEDRMVAVVARTPLAASRGVLIVVGGPQYRAGSHRQFTLLARALAEAGIPSMRFDYRGMGDSEGLPRSFEHVQSDIRDAVDAFFSQLPEMREVVLWGLCDAASAALFYAPSDRRVCGLVLLNPWVRTPEGIAAAYLRTYYLRRLRDPEFWRKLGSGRFDMGASLRSFGALARDAILGRREAAEAIAGTAVLSEAAPADAATLPQRMLEGMRRFRGRVLFILSGDDLTAQEFRDLVKASGGWRRVMRRAGVSRRDLAAANHTFARAEWRNQVARWTTEWVLAR